MQVARVESLLGTVSDVLATLSRSSAQLREEFRVLTAQALHEASADVIRTMRVLESENQQLKDALTHRAAIEQAKGILMVLWNCSPEEAFERLGALSRQRRRKVRELAADVVQTRGAVVAEPSWTGESCEPATSADAPGPSSPVTVVGSAPRTGAGRTASGRATRAVVDLREGRQLGTAARQAAEE
jgi:hypothetical protein